MASTPFIRTARAGISPQPLPPDVRWMRLAANALLAVAVGVIAALGAHLLTRQPAFALRGIHIDGELSRNSVATIRVNAVPRLRGNFFTTDLQAAQRAFESVPWVRRAVVQRVWPNRIAVRLEEHQPAALWRVAGAIEGDAAERLVNTHGEVFEANLGDVEGEGLPVLEGPEGSAAAMLAMLLRLQATFGLLESHVETLRLSGRASWRAELDSGAQVELGRGSDDEVLARAQRYARTVTQMTQQFQAPVVYADLRHRDGYALRLRGITTVAASGASAKQ